MDSVQGKHLYQYCFNNPVNRSDHSGNWPELPEWLEDVGKCASDAIKIFGKLAETCMEAATFSLGGGFGFGIKDFTTVFKKNIGGEIGIVSSTSIVYEKGKSDIVASTLVTAGLGNIFTIENGREHSYNDCRIHCDMLNLTYKEL